jgi:hypothetical protein
MSCLCCVLRNLDKAGNKLGFGYSISFKSFLQL